MRSVLRVVHLRVPVWVAALYSLLSVILIPWTFYLSVTLPARHLSSHWGVSWVGLDVGLVILLLLTGLLAYLKSDWVVITATATGSFLIVDAWFDIMSAQSKSDFQEAIGMALLVELPLAAISYIAAHKIVLKNVRLATEAAHTTTDSPIDTAVDDSSRAYESFPGDDAPERITPKL
jgi:hypothetical protein